MRKNIKPLLTILFILIVLVTIGISYMTYMINKIETNASNSIDTITKTDAENLNTKISKQKEILQTVASQITQDNEINEEKIFDLYEKSEITSNFIRMGIMYEDGYTITNDGYELDYSSEKENFFSDAEILISENRKSKINGEEINIYSKMIKIKKEKIAILLIVNTNSYKDIFSNKIFEGEGFSYITNREGNIVVSSNKEIDSKKIADILQNNKDKKTKIIDIDGNKYYMAQENIEVNKWSIVSFIPSKTIAGEINKALLTTFIMVIVVIIVILTILSYIVIINFKRRKNYSALEKQIEKDMKKALKDNEFVVYYQPKVYAKTGKIYGAEALVRWKKNDKMIMPSVFIPIFERNKFILKLDLYIFERVCKDMKEWKENYGVDIPISINVSRKHLVEKDFINDYAKIANKYGISTEKLDLEITESATIDSKIDMIKIMKEIKKAGFLISIDDFGTGYSSLNILYDMPIDILKIDKSFVDQNIVEDILNIAKKFKLKTIAEGVETKTQKEYLTEKGCDILQGYYYSKPLQKEEFISNVMKQANF
jgi:sensor c-di-GMP phosphodiesterase-like protein